MRTSPAARDKLRQVLTDPGQLATPLFVLWLDTYVVGEEPDEQKAVMAWDPQTVLAELNDDFGVEVPRPVLDKILAAREIVTSDRFFTRLPDFIELCNVLSGDVFDPTVFDPADAAECAWGITEALVLSPPDDADQEPFAAEIAAYVAAVVDQEGLVDPPDVLRLGRTDPGPGTGAAAWSDDPVMFNAIWDRNRERSADVRRVVRDRLVLLVRQLEALPLARGDTTGVLEKLRRVVPSA